MHSISLVVVIWLFLFLIDVGEGVLKLLLKQRDQILKDVLVQTIFKDKTSSDFLWVRVLEQCNSGLSIVLTKIHVYIEKWVFSVVIRVFKVLLYLMLWIPCILVLQLQWLWAWGCGAIVLSSSKRASNWSRLRSFSCLASWPCIAWNSNLFSSHLRRSSSLSLSSSSLMWIWLECILIRILQ